MDVIRRHNIRVSGRENGRTILFAHGFGCDQSMWRFVAPHFEQHYSVVLFDLAGAGGADRNAYDPAKHSSLDGYADDILEICRELELSDVIFVGHSVSAIIGVLASLRAPKLFAHLVLVGPSPRYINDEGYVGGFNESDIVELLDSLDSNYLGWSAAMAPVVMGNPDRPELGHELTESFCRTDPEIARRFARVTFLSDNRDDLPQVTTATLILQCRNDAIAPVQVGQYVHRAIPNSSLTLLDATGHCPHLSSPDETIKAIDAYLEGHSGS
jgi:sigma-B regulation protein RsbQ